MKISKNALFACALIAGSLLSGCSDFKTLSASLLSQTGYVNSTQAEGLLNAGSQLAKSQEGLTNEQEYYLGRAVSAKILGKFAPLTKPELVRYVNKVGLALASVSDVPETFGGYHFVVINSPHVNAMSAPGGFVYVSSGFVRKLPDEDALAAVLAHEIGHVVKRHGVNAISNAALFGALAGATKEGISIAANNTSSPVNLGALTDMFADSVSGITDKLLTKGFDRKQEYEADLYAAALMQRAGYDPNALVRVLEILEKSTGKDDEGWFATHPAPDDRIDELKDSFEFPASAQNPGRQARFRAAVSGL
jgi:predicted Zn-dependent protease